MGLALQLTVSAKGGSSCLRQITTSQAMTILLSVVLHWMGKIRVCLWDVTVPQQRIVLCGTYTKTLQIVYVPGVLSQ